MTKLKYIRSKSREEWLAQRKQMTAMGMVGGTDSGTILGLNNYKSRVKLFYQAVGYEPMTDNDNEIMFHGRNLEDYVANLWQYYDGTPDSLIQNYENKKKVRVARKLKAMVVNPKYPWMFANVDRVIAKHPDKAGKGILEIKTMSSYHSEMWQGGIPPAYIIQIQHYLIVTGYKYAEIALLMDGRKFDTVPFDAHDGIQKNILEATQDFNSRVLKGLEIMQMGMPDDELVSALSEIQPDPESNEAFDDYMSERHKRRMSEKTIDGGSTIIELAKEYKTAQDRYKYAETEKIRVAGAIKNYMESNSATVVKLGDNGAITWRKQLNVNYKENKDVEVDFGF
jgi:putative phage-type endonuclease